MKTDRGLIAYLRDLKPSDASGEITETEFDRWLEKACKFPDEGWIFYGGEWIKYKHVNGELQIIERRAD